MRKRLYKFLHIIVLICIINGSRGKLEKRQINEKDIEAIRKEIIQSQQNGNSVSREKSLETMAEITLLKDNISSSSNVPFQLSANLTNWLKEGSQKVPGNVKVGMMAEEAIEDPNINIIDHHVKEIVNSNVLNSFQPDFEEIKELTKLKHSENSNIHNLYRENLNIKFIREEPNFHIGSDVEQWKTIVLEKDVVLIGQSNNTISICSGTDNDYKIVKQFEIIEAKHSNMCMEAINIWDSALNRIRNMILIGVNGNLIWYEYLENDIHEISRWRLMKNIDKVLYFQHDGSDLIMVTTNDEGKRAEVEFIEFNLQTEEFWVVQSFKLPILPKSVAFLDVGKDLIVAFTQESHVTIYRQQSTKFEKAKFSFLKNIDAANLSVINGFRIGGHSYLAIGGDQPQILRYFNGDFHPQTILSQTFGHVEEFLAIPIKIYRDDLVLLVQHSIKFRTHTLVVVDALIWNGIAFETAVSFPCKIAADPHAHGFTCMLDFERPEGLLGAAIIIAEKNNSFYIVIPRHEAHSGMFKVEYEIVEAEDPLMKEIENIRTAIELINGMLDLETTVRLQVEEALQLSLNPKNSFTFEGISLDEINAELIHFDGNVSVNSDKIEFLDKSFSREDFITNLDEIEKTLNEDEQKVREIDAHLNKFIRKNRQTPVPQENIDIQDSPIYHLGPFTFNGQLDAKTLRVIPQHENTQRQKRQIDPIDETRLSELRVNDITVRNINGIPVNDILFLENGILNVPDKNIVFRESVQADNVIMKNDGKINGIDFSHEILAIDSPNFPKSLSFDKVVTDYLYVNKLNDIAVDTSSLQNISIEFGEDMKIISTKEAFMHQGLKVKTINGINWEKLTSNIVPINKPSSTIGNLTVNGNIVFIDYSSALNANSLNGLSFPNEYVLTAGPTETIISGKKTFTRKLHTKAVDTDGTINSIEPSKIITLDQPQNIEAETTFNTLEVMKKLEVHGTVSGQKLEEFLPNPTLEYSREILADCTFKELVVEGSIKVENSLNGQNVQTLLQEIIYESHEETIVTGQKIFKNLAIKNNAIISSGYLESILIDSLMTKDGDQTIVIDTIFGDIYFSNLKLLGLFDGINATDLEMNSIRTFGEQFIQTPLIITDHFSAKSIVIKHSINDVLNADYYFIDEPIIFSPNMKIGMADLTVDNIKVNSDIIGAGVFGSLNLKGFEQTYLSKSLEQNIASPVKIDKLIVDGIFNGKIVNNMNFEIFKGYLMELKNFRTNLLSGKHKLDSLIIDGNVNLRYINDQDFEFIKNHVIWLNKPNVVDGILNFLDEIDIHEGLIVEKNVNGKNFTRFIENWISKNEDPVVIRSDKIINKSVLVEENLEVGEINKIPYENIFRKDDMMEAQHLNIIGTVMADKLYVKNNFNREKASTLESIYLFEQDTNRYTINTNMKLNQNAQINNLNAPYLNKLNVSYWLNDLIKINDNHIYLKGVKTFKMPIFAEKMLYVDMFNDINIKDLLQKIIVFKNNEIVNVHSNIQLLGDFSADLVGLRGNLSTDFINDIHLHEWIQNALPTHKDVHYKDTLKADSRFIQAYNINVGAINGVPFDDILTLHTNQSFDYNIIVEGSVSVKNPLIVHGLVNQMNLQIERDNTVMINEKHQEIYTKIIMNDALVLNSVVTNGLISSKDIQNIVSLNSSPIFDSSLAFNSLEATALISEDRISGINFTKWHENTLWKKGKEIQVVYGNWKIKTVHLLDNVHGNGLINGQSINEIEKNLKKNVNEIEIALNNYSVEYKNMCQKLQYRADDYAKGSVYVLKYFEEAFKIVEDKSIFSYYLFHTKDHQHYLFVNTNCTTNIYKWKQSEEHFVKLSFIETGVVYSWNKIEPETSNELFIITNSKMTASAPCLYGGTNTWKLIDDKLIHISSISYEADILEIFVHPSNPKSFYALENSDIVINFDEYGRKLEEWKLPDENYTYSFLGADILSGLNLNNGRRIYSIESKYLRRKQRSIDSNAPVLKVTRNKTHHDDSPTYTFKKPDFPNYSIPTIPSKQVTTTKRIDFLSKVKGAGDVIRRSFNIQTAYMSPNETKISRLSDSDTNKLLFSIKSPNISALREKMHKNLNVTKKVDTEDDQKMIGEMEELHHDLENGLVMENIDGVISSTEASLKSEEATTISSESKYMFTPRIIMSDDNDKIYSSDNETVRAEENSFKNEQIIDAVIIKGDGVRDTENYLIPEHGQGEIVVLYVGTKKNRKTLYAVSRKRNSVIQGNSVIEIYSDIIEGQVFQNIVCLDPSNIHALHFRDETLLAFMESRREVKIYIYRGIQGFTLFKKFTLPDYAYQMSSVTLPPKLLYKCDQRYLVFHFEKEILFMTVKVDGNCGLRHIECDGF